jgi:hypothetical protein
VVIEASLNDNNTSAIAQVVETRIEEHIFKEPFEFEYNTCRIKEGRRKRNLKLYVRYPEVIAINITIDVLSRVK